MFASDSLIANRERAAVLALMTGKAMPWNRLAGAIEEDGSALRLLEQGRAADAPDQLFPVEDKLASLDQMEEYVADLAREGIAVITVLDDEYPINLRMVHDRPPALFVRGALDAGDERSVAVVGTRKATDRGLADARTIAAAVIDANYVVVSGLAAGIDTAAHRSALDVGARTVAVIGTGHRHAFPASNSELQSRIATEGAVVSQFWPGQEARRWTFPQRNAVMSGFARATVVIEASHTSGARMQARLALEHGRPVFLVRSLMEHEWARGYRDRPGVYVIDDGAEVVAHLARLYAQPQQLALVR